MYLIYSIWVQILLDSASLYIESFGIQPDGNESCLMDHCTANIIMRDYDLSMGIQLIMNTSMYPNSTNTLWCFHVFSCMVSKWGLNTKERWWKSSLNLVQHIWKLNNCANSFHIICGVFYIYQSHIICHIQNNFSLDPIKIRHICLDHSTFRMMRKLLSIILVLTSIWATKFLEEIQEHTCDSICHFMDHNDTM